ncbi:MAG: DUF2497 domain-containing protein [Pseudomonadota bacterium]
MSEQTPEPNASAADDGFANADAEPSMEDILASIRKIIADDSEPVPMDAPEADVVPSSVTVEAVAATHVEARVEPAPMASVTEALQSDDGLIDDGEFDIDALLTDFDVIEPDTAPKPAAKVDGATEAYTSVEDDLSIPAIPDDAAVVKPAASSGDDDMDRLMDELLVGMDDDVVGAPDAAEGPVSETVAPSAPEDDMDLVRSLMADLTDDDAPSHFPDDPIATDVSEPEVQADPLDAMEDNILDTMLDMTLENEMASFEAAEAARESAPASNHDAVPSLSDIAAAAEAEARSVPAAEAAALLGGATRAAAEEPVTEISGDTLTPMNASVPDAADQPAMETPMPRAARSDAILDDMTEEATMSAFAELNQVVEDKAILSERGPRIGDLVQEALKPMLKEWLDENLQGIVERAVAKEVKRIASGK